MLYPEMPSLINLRSNPQGALGLVVHSQRVFSHVTYLLETQSYVRCLIIDFDTTGHSILGYFLD